MNCYDTSQPVDEELMTSFWCYLGLRCGSA